MTHITNPDTHTVLAITDTSDNTELLVHRGSADIVPTGALATLEVLIPEEERLLGEHGVELYLTQADARALRNALDALLVRALPNGQE